MTVAASMWRAALLALALSASPGPIRAGEAAAHAAAAAAPAPAPVIRAEYEVRDAHGTRRLVMVRGTDRIEYRLQGEPVEVWRRTPDGIARLELFADARRSIAWAPGDLRTVGEARTWEQLASPVNPDLRQRLQARGQTRAFDGPAIRYRGASAEGGTIELDWSPGLALPTRYRSTAARGAPADRRDAYQLRLRSLQRDVGEQAFTDTTGYRETDYADLGDMELDPFAAGYLKRQGGHVH